MTRLRKQLPANLGSGELLYGSYKGLVSYEVRGEPSSLRLGPLRGCAALLTTTPEVAAEVFRAGEARLKPAGPGTGVPHHRRRPFGRIGRRLFRDAGLTQTRRHDRRSDQPRA